jgi:tetratricopeptide (TPR) repeat protein
MRSASRFFMYEPISPKLRRLLYSLGLITVLGIGIWLAPYPLSLYHQTRGGQLLEEILSKNSISPGSTACERTPLANETARMHVIQAIRELQKAMEYNPKDAQSYLFLGQAYCLVGEPDKAIDAYLVFSDLRPDNPLGDLESGFAYEAIGDWSSAVNKWKIAGLTAQDFLENGEHLHKQKLYEEALKWYERAGRLSPNWAEPLYRIGLVYKEQENWEKAISAYLQAAQLLPGNRDIWYELGYAYSLRQEWDLALQAYEQGLQANSGQVGLSNFYFRIGVIRQYSLSPRDFEGAWEAYDRALKSDDYPVDYWMRADTYYQKGVILGRSKHWEDALQEYQKALALNPRHYWAHLLSASTLWELEREEEAKEMAQKAVSLEPNKKNGYMLLGDFYSAETNISQASTMYMKVLEIDPQDQAARSALEGLGGIYP